MRVWKSEFGRRGRQRVLLVMELMPSQRNRQKRADQTYRKFRSFCFLCIDDRLSAKGIDVDYEPIDFPVYSLPNGANTRVR
jgi:hypothetical protein